MRKLNIKTVNTHSHSVNVTRLGYDSFNIPEYAVILGNGLCVEVGMGLHIYGFAIAATIYLAENHVGDLPIEINGCTTGEELFLSLKRLIDSEGCVSEENSRPFTSLYLITYSFEKVRAEDTWPELKSIVKDSIFINSKYNKTEKTKFGKEFARKWIENNSDLIWGIRVISYMYTDEFFWDENQKTEWNHLMCDKLGVKLPSINHFITNQATSTFSTRLKLPTLIQDLFPKNKQPIVENVIENYPTIREMYGTEAWYGSFWLDNFTTNDLDELLFQSESKTDGPSIAKTKEIEELTNGRIIINDNYMGITIELERKDIIEVSYGIDSDEGYLKFIAPKDILLKQLYKKGEVISAYSIDEYSNVTIIKE